MFVFLSLAGCEKGCLSGWARDHGVGGALPRASNEVSLDGTDCSDGLARCVSGRVETSRAAHLPHPCTTPEGRTCACPWGAGSSCDAGCVEERLEVVAPADVAEVQLCRPAAPVVRPVLPGEPRGAGICDAAGVTCVDGRLRACDAPGKPVRVVAACVHGCEPRIGLSSEHGDPATLDGAAAILCARLHAERR